MSGILFIICIPTVEEEDCILAKLQSDSATQNGTERTPTKPKDASPLLHQYGTFDKEVKESIVQLSHCWKI